VGVVDVTFLSDGTMRTDRVVSATNTPEPEFTTIEEVNAEEARERARKRRIAERQWYRLTFRNGDVAYRELPRDGEEVSHMIVRSSDPGYYIASVEPCDGPPPEAKPKKGAG
jgi:hypothetical protein